MKTHIPKFCFTHAAAGLANIHTLSVHRCGRSIVDAVPVPTAQEIVRAWNAGYRRRAVAAINQHRNKP